MSKSTAKSELLLLLKEAGDVFKFASRRVKILAALTWGPEVVEEFFRKKEGALPVPRYSIDHRMLSECREALEKLTPRLQGPHPVTQWLGRMQRSFLDGIQLLCEIETSSFFEVSTRLYGNSQSQTFKGQSPNLELARLISSRMSAPSLNDIEENVAHKSAEQFAAALEKKIAFREPLLPVRVELTDQIVAKVVAGMSRVRIRKDARFSDLDLEALWHHEIESHCLTAHNGSQQGACDFLVSGGPRTTTTQEGLAVFYEIYGHTMSQRRFITLCNRIEAVHLAESGGNFLDIYRWYLEHGDTKTDAFYNTQRIFRGARLTGGAPFTKDVVYLSGMIGVYNFLRIAVKNQNRLLVESLVCGRMALEDVATIAWLRAHGIAQPPRFVPDWLKNWEALLSSFSLGAVLSNTDLGAFQGYFDEYNTLESWDLSV